MKTFIISATVATLVALASCAAPRTASAHGKEYTEPNKEEKAISIKTLDGDWKIVSLGDKEEIVPPIPERTPRMTFSMADMRISATVGCNLINAAIITDEEKPDALSFGRAISTMMACPDMAIEQTLSTVLQECSSFSIKGETLQLYNAEGKLLATLRR